MTSYFPQNAPQAGNRWLLSLLQSILAAESPIVIVDSVNLAPVAECQVTEDGEAIRGMRTWKNTTSSALLRTVTVERVIYGGLVPPPVVEIALGPLPHLDPSTLICYPRLIDPIKLRGVANGREMNVCSCLLGSSFFRKERKPCEVMPKQIGRSPTLTDTE
jgi:hypothetical protein